MIRLRPVLKVIGVLLLLLGLLMLACLPFSYRFGAMDAEPLVLSAIVCLLAGLTVWVPQRRVAVRVGKREGYLIVAGGWMAMVSFGMLPYLFSGLIPTVPEAFFETMSGMTTTGATVLTDIEAAPRGLLFWRSLTQWIGGMGIIVLTVAIFPLLGIAGIELFTAEAPGPSADKIHPRIQETAKRLWLLYVGLTTLLALLLKLEGMSFYEALNHALTTMATGGFSTQNESIAAFPNPLIQYTLVVFMFLAGNNYTVTYWALKGRWRNVWGNDEFRFYLIVVLLTAGFVALIVVHRLELPLEQAWRDSLFQVVSLITTTGYVSADYTQWGPALTMLCFVLMFVGACAGSTSGGIKLVRHLVFLRNSVLEFKRLLHPHAILPLKLNNQAVAPRIMTHIIIFLLLYLIVFVFGSLAMSGLGYDFETAVGAVATCLGNVGPGIGSVGPVDNFAHLNVPAKWLLSFLMLLGRLELFTILVLLTPYFWKSN